MAARPPPPPPPRPGGRPGVPAAPAHRAVPPPPPPPPPVLDAPGFHMSGTEALHLGVSLIALSIAFAFAFAPCQGPAGQPVECPLLRDPGSLNVNAALMLLPQTFVLVLLGFLLHEMAHKVVAQRLHLWAEFRASLGGLAMALGFCTFTSLIFAAPGAVLIVGNATRKDGALISIAGPATNLALCLALLPLASGAPDPAEFGVFGNFFQVAVLVNSLLAFFNLLPFPPLDGSKIIRWNVPVWVAMFGGAVLLFLRANRLL